MSRKEWAMIRVHPKFKKKLKRQCIEQDLGIIDLTERIAEASEGLEEHFKKINKNFGRIL